MESPLLDVNVCGMNRQNALMVAARFGSAETLKRMLDRKDIRLDALDENGISAIEYACACPKNLFLLVTDPRFDAKAELERLERDYEKLDDELELFQESDLPKTIRRILSNPKLFLEEL